MSKKKGGKKVSSTEKVNRRLKEIVKAQAKSGARGEYLELLTGAITGDPGIGADVDAKQPKKLDQRLHLNVIKTDLIKTSLYVIFVIAILIILKRSNLELNLGIYK